MSAIMVNSTQLRQKATQLEQYNKQFKQRVDTLGEKERSLGTMWEGEAKKAFHNEFTKDTQQFMNFYNGINQYVQALRDAADQYEKAEQKSLELAKTRK